MGKMLRPVSEHEIQTFVSDGVVCLRGIVAEPDVDNLRQSIDDAMATLDQSYGGYDLTAIAQAVEDDDFSTLKAQSDRQYGVEALAAVIKQSGATLLRDESIRNSGKSGHFCVDTGVASRNAVFRRFVIDGPGPEIAANLLRSDKINFYDDQVLVKGPGTAERTAYHQDSTYFNLDGDQTCVMWIPVDRVSQDGGTVRYIRGSHLWGKDYKPNIFLSQMAFPGSDGVSLPDIETFEDAFDIISFEVEPGDIIVHHYKIIHGAGGNATDRPRRAASLRYCGDDMRYKFRPYAPPQIHHHHALKDGDLLDSEQFPIVWRGQPRRVAA